MRGQKLSFFNGAVSKHRHSPIFYIEFYPNNILL